VTVVGDLYVSGGIYGNGANVTGVLAAGSGGTTSAGNLSIQYGTGGSGEVVFTANTTEVARMYYNGNMTFDAGTLYVDAVQNRVGVNTSAPTSSLHVVGSARVTQDLVVGYQLIGGIGSSSTSGTLNWNDSSNARSGNGTTLLFGDATNGPGAAGKYYHPFSFEHSSKDGTGNLTQFAIPYAVDLDATNALAMRSRASGTWSSWVGFVEQPLGTAGITVNSSGQVGINNTSPGSRLDVVGNAQVTGRLTLAGSTAGVAFPSSQIDTNLYNCLDDYEEGTFTPTISAVTASPSYSLQRGVYTKIGNRVFFDINLTFTLGAVGTGSSPQIAGLPFTSANLSPASYSSILIGYRTGWNSKPERGYVNTNASTITLLTSAYVGIAAGDLTATTHTLYLSGSYITNQATA
jgi:hypothetical protein